jgi:hypothetical protein
VPRLSAFTSILIIYYAPGFDRAIIAPWQFLSASWFVEKKSAANIPKPAPRTGRKHGCMVIVFFVCLYRGYSLRQGIATSTKP